MRCVPQHRAKLELAACGSLRLCSQYVKALQAAPDRAASDRYADLSARLQQARSLDEVEEWAAYCRLVMPPPVDMATLAIDEPQQQLRPLKSTRYQAYIRADVGALAARLAMPTDDFAALVDTISPETPKGNTALVPPPREMLSSTPEEAVQIHVAVHMDVSDMSEEQKHRALQQAQYVLMQVCTACSLTCRY